jgi:hypothetical protein
VAAQIRNDQAMPGGETLEYWVEHLAGDHQPVHQQQGLTRSALGELN